MDLSYLPVARAAPQLKAVDHATDGLAATGWTVVAATRSPVLRARGAVEWLVRARR
jgi:hypothetical protein